MPLKAVVDTLDDLPASLERFYLKQNDGPLRGKFLLAVEPVRGVELVDVEPLRKEENRLWTALEGRLVRDAITQSVATAGGCHALLEPHIKARTQIDRASLAVTVLRDDGQPLYNNKGLPATIDDLVADLKKHPDYVRAFAGEPASSGTSADVQSKTSHPWGEGSFTDHLRQVAAERASRPKELETISGNPFRRDSWNVTAQGLIARADPRRAEQLRAAAEGGGS